MAKLRRPMAESYLAALWGQKCSDGLLRNRSALARLQVGPKATIRECDLSKRMLYEKDGGT